MRLVYKYFGRRSQAESGSEKKTEFFEKLGFFWIIP